MMNIGPLNSLPPAPNGNPGIAPPWMSAQPTESFPWWPWWYGQIPGTWHPETKTFVPTNPANLELMALDKAPEGFYNNPEAFIA